MHPKSFQRFFYPPDGGAPGGSAPGSDAGSATPPAAPASGGQPGSGTAPPAAAAPGTGSPQYTYTEDRSGWIPPYRYQQLQERQREFDRVQRERDLATSRFQALAGITPQENPQHVEVRNALMEVFPQLKLLGDATKFGSLEKLIEMANSGQLGEAVGTSQAYWQRHATQTAQGAVDAYAKAAGVEAKDLPPNTVRRMARLLMDFVEEDRSGQRQQQFEAADPRLIQSFMEDMGGVFINPLRKSFSTQAATQVQTNQRLPQRGPAGGPPPAGAPPRLRGKELSAAARQFVVNSRG